MKRKYLVSYSFLKDERSQLGIGRVSFETDCKIERIIDQSEKQLCDKFNFRNVSITNISEIYKSQTLSQKHGIRK